MPKRTKNSPAGKGVVAVMLLTMLGAGGLAAYVKLTPQAAHVIQDHKVADPEVTVRTESTSKPSVERDDQSSSLFVPTVQDNDVKLIKVAATPAEGVKPEISLLNETLQGLQIEGARAVGIDIQNGTAMVDFNPAIQKGYGTIEEGYVIKSLQMALGQFKNISKFQVIVEGKPIDSLGNIDLTTPVPVIRPGQVSSKSNETEEKP